MSKTDSINSKLGDLKIRQVILDMDAYLPPLESRDPEKHLLMDFNESPVPPQEKVIQAVSDFLSRRAHVYPAYHGFLKTLSNYTGVAENQLILSNARIRELNSSYAVFWKAVMNS
ncbi:MAG: hypothetical protein ACJ0DH_09540 [bacterium]